MRYMSAPAPVSFRFAPEVKALLEKAAAASHRSQANLLEHLLIEYCKKEGIGKKAPTPKAASNIS